MGFISKMKGLFRGEKKDVPEHSVPPILAANKISNDNDQTPEKKVFSLDTVKQHLDQLKTRHKRVHAAIVATVACLTVAGLAAADISFMGGLLTTTALGCIYADWRNGQQIKKITGELAALDRKLDAISRDHNPIPDLGPALSPVLSEVRRTAVAFQQAADRKITPEMQRELKALLAQIDHLEEKVGIQPSGVKTDLPPSPPAPDFRKTG